MGEFVTDYLPRTRAGLELLTNRMDLFDADVRRAGMDPSTGGGKARAGLRMAWIEEIRKIEDEAAHLCESQINELVRELQYIVDSKAFSQLSHAKQDHLKRAIRNRGLPGR